MGYLFTIPDSKCFNIDYNYTYNTLKYVLENIPTIIKENRFICTLYYTDTHCYYSLTTVINVSGLLVCIVIVYINDNVIFKNNNITFK